MDKGTSSRGNGSSSREIFGLSRMTARGTDRGHRVSSPLELLFDLCFVVAVSIASVQLHHSIVEGHVGAGVQSFASVFFAIWWAWMNFSWFASQFDTDDWLYRVFTLLQMAGVLVLAAGVQSAFVDFDYRLVTIGYFVMRLPLIAQWVRAAVSDPTNRVPALRYAAGLALIQGLWFLRLLLPAESLGFPSFLVLVVLEISLPAIAERGRVIPWHPHHIAERYGLFTLIVLGESILAATNAFIEGFNETDHPLGLIVLAFAALVIVFGMWWVYFDQSPAARLTNLKSSLIWGYGHYFVFAGAAAVSAGLEAAIDYDLFRLGEEGKLAPEAQEAFAEQLASGEHHVSGLAAALATNVSVAMFLFGVWLLMARHRRIPLLDAGYLIGVVAVIGVSFTGAPIHLAALVTVGLVVVTVISSARPPGARVD